MHLIPREVDKILLTQAGLLAQRRLWRGLKLNHSEATALIATVCLELIRDGNHSVAELMSLGRTLLGREDVLSGVSHSVHVVQIEGTFPDGTKLVTIHEPIATRHGNLRLALHGAALPLPAPKEEMVILHNQEEEAISVPGEVVVSTKEPVITINPGRERTTLLVTNRGDRPVQVGSHFHFIEANKMLDFDRLRAYGLRLDVAAGTAVRFEPGDSKPVSLIPIAGNKIIRGGNNIASGPVDVTNIPQIMKKLEKAGFLHTPMLKAMPAAAPFTMSRERYAAAFGPTVGDRIRLSDSSLWIEIEKDFTSYGDEAVFGGGKVLRDGMGQAAGVSQADALDLVITNCVIVDYTGIYKADIGIKDGLIAGIGKSGNPDVMHNVTPGMSVGATTEALAGEGHIFTAGGLDTHVHFICPQLCDEAIATGITTMIGGGTGPNTGTNATTCTPGKSHMRMMLRACDDKPLNIGFTGKGNSSSKSGLREQVEAGALGLKLHEDWGSTPAAIDCCLEVCEEFDVQATIHTDTLNEAGFVESTLEAFKNRTIHAYHTEGAGGGHAPDIITVCGNEHMNVIPSSTNPTRPFTKNTIDEHLDMLMVCHHLSKNVPEDIAFAESRIRGETIGAEGILHDMGAICAISSDSQAMGRIGEVITRCWQTADKMKQVRGHLKADEGELDLADNFRVRRYVAKYTINPAIAHGVSHVVGSVEVGKLADLVMYKPEFFGTKPELIIKGGMIAWAQMGDANASIPTPQPVIMRPMFGAHPSAIGKTSFAFVSQVSITNGQVASYGLRKMIEPVKNCRKIGKMDMKLNNFCPSMTVDPETYVVTINGETHPNPPAQKLPMATGLCIF
ncbi:hypothetical protein HDU98_009807 [Podochytrium sp. JEL0797]|nr:hypothetical protein HDU98_009807 [Podochytrium sp. JEL0797]